MEMRRSISVAGLLGIVACGGSNAASVARPSDPTAAAALDESQCHDVAGKAGEPLIVDWRPEQRGDLEIAMKQGIAVIAYDCKGIRLLNDCHLDGSYAFIGTTRSEQVVQLANADEVRANLPLSGASLGAEVSGASAIDIAMVMVGKKSTTLSGPAKADLKGSCDGATHFVRRATVGAFAMGTGTEGKAKAVAEVFGAGASGASTSSKKVQNKEGDVTDCAKATPESATPPAQCGAPIRLYVEPIAAEGKAAAPPAAAQAKVEAPVVTSPSDACPNGLVYTDGKCTAPNAAPTHVCKSNDLRDCTDQCTKGNAGSCGELGIMYGDGVGGATRDPKKGVDLMKKGCDGGSLRSCAYLSLAYAAGVGVAQDPQTGVQIAEKACAGGDARGCYELGRFYISSLPGIKDDPARAATLFQRACDGGYPNGCSFLADFYAKGRAVAKDPAKSNELFKRACDGGHGYGCAKTGETFETGRGATKDDARATALYARGCNLGNMEACADLGRIVYPKNPDNARKALDQACSNTDQIGGSKLVGCAALKLAFGDTRFSFKMSDDLNEMNQGCLAGDAHACTSFGLVNAAAGFNPAGKNNLKKGCSGGDAFACAALKNVK